MKNTLPKPRQAALEKIAGQSRDLNREWVPTDDIDLRPLNALEAAHLIVQMKSDGNRSARVTQAGWAQVDGVPPLPVPAPDPEPMEADTPDARKPSGHVLHGPFPKREPVTSLTGRHAPVLEPEPPEPAAPPPPAQVAELSTGQIVEDCPDCIHADILHIVAVMYPEIADVVDILTRAKHIERDLKREGANGRHSE